MSRSPAASYAPDNDHPRDDFRMTDRSIKVLATGFAPDIPGHVGQILLHDRERPSALCSVT